MKKQLLLLLVSFFISNLLFATHNMAGEIIFKQLDWLNVEASVITYTNISSVAADRDSLTICWGDGTCDIIGRVNGPNNQGEPIGPNTKKNIYTKTHTYALYAHYIISMTDYNRNADILNVNFPNSQDVLFKLQTELTVLHLTTMGPNTSPILLQPPIDAAFTGEPYLHTPNAFDPDGDSIAYELITPIAVPNYVPVTEIQPGPNNTLTLNEETGLLIWNAPQMEGLYTIAYLVKSYRDGEEIDRTIRDMQIEVTEGPGFAPEITMENITGNEEIIIVDLGDTVNLEISVEDLDIAQELEITSTCGLYDYFDNNANFNSTSAGNSGTATFEWVVKAEHLREQPYQVVFKAEDNTSGHSKSQLAVVRYKTSSATVGINDISQSAGIELFPNPVQDGFINLRIDAADFYPREYLIFNALGQPVRQGLILSDFTKLDVSDFSKGTYFFQFASEYSNRVTSFVIQ